MAVRMAVAVKAANANKIKTAVTTAKNWASKGVVRAEGPDPMTCQAVAVVLAWCRMIVCSFSTITTGHPA
jgi:hypothetical protein